MTIKSKGKKIVISDSKYGLTGWEAAVYNIAANEQMRFFNYQPF